MHGQRSKRKNLQKELDWVWRYDTGIGMEEQHIPRVTERFYRVDESRSVNTGGTGLGLAIVKHVAASHRAELEIESELGKGSTFSLRFSLS